MFAVQNDAVEKAIDEPRNEALTAWQEKQKVVVGAFEQSLDPFATLFVEALCGGGVPFGHGLVSCWVSRSFEQMLEPKPIRIHFCLQLVG